jgi:hypothetical protein
VVWVAPVALDDAGVPAQHGAWRDDQEQLAALLVRDQPGQRGWDRAVGPGGSGCFDEALEHGDLVAQDQNLGVFGQV